MPLDHVIHVQGHFGTSVAVLAGVLVSGHDVAPRKANATQVHAVVELQHQNPWNTQMTTGRTNHVFMYCIRQCIQLSEIKHLVFVVECFGDAAMLKHGEAALHINNVYRLKVC